MIVKAFRSIFLLILAGLCWSTVQGQDIHFSQFYASPLTLNPGNTGHYVGDWRIMNNYRTQWRTVGEPFVTNAIAFDKQFYLRSDKVSAGLVVINDQSGDARLTVNKFLLSGAYARSFGGHNFSAGIQMGLVMKSFDVAALTFPEQFDMSTGGFNNTLSNGETNLGAQTAYFDINIGIVWDRKFGKVHPEAGIAIFHLNRPNESFFDERNPLTMREVLFGSARIDLNERFYVKPNLLFMTTTKATDFIVGTNGGMNFGQNPINAKSFYMGIQLRDGWQRNTDAMVAITGLEFKQLDVGISYDINVSELQAVTNRRGAFEISVIYRALSSVLTKTAIPCDRY